MIELNVSRQPERNDRRHATDRFPTGTSAIRVAHPELIKSQQRERESRRTGTACFIHSDLFFAAATNVTGVRSFSEDSATVRPGETTQLIESQQRASDNMRIGTACFVNADLFFATATNVIGVRSFSEDNATVRPGETIELIESRQRECESRRIETACLIHSDLVFATATNVTGVCSFSEDSATVRPGETIELIESRQRASDNMRTGTACFVHSDLFFAAATNVAGVRSFSGDSAPVRPGVIIELIESRQRERESRRIGTACFVHSDLFFATATNVIGVRSFSEDSATVRPGETIELIKSRQRAIDNMRIGTACFVHSDLFFATATNVTGVRSFSEDSATVRPGVIIELIKSQQRASDNMRAGTGCLITRTTLIGARAFPECGSIDPTFAEAAHD
jgi:hypothetical protein